jgi:nicotinate phosphoribosyltransferase
MSDGFHLATPEDIRSGKVSDVYFVRGTQVLTAVGKDPFVVVEIRAARLPEGWPWAVFAGLDEALTLLDGRGVEVRAIAEGSVFYAEEPVVVVAGRYLAFSELETALLGLLSQASGIATAAARCKIAAAGRPVYSFGARRLHPGIAPMVERAAYIGGCDGVGTLAGAELIGLPAVGTLSHGLVLTLGEEEAWRSFDRVIDPRIPRVLIVDTFQDEKFGALAAAQILGDRLAAVRIDTPASRRGSLISILREVRWELDQRGFSGVRILCSGGIQETQIPELNRYADAYGIGASISNAPTLDFALDIVEVEGSPRAKRGKLSGRKHLWACPECSNRGIAPGITKLGHCPRCGHRVRSLLDARISRDGRRRRLPTPQEIRQHALDEVSRLADPFTREE